MLEFNIIDNLDNPEILEKLYRKDKKSFSEAFRSALPKIESNNITAYWKTRIEADLLWQNSTSIKNHEIVILIVSAIISAFLVQIPNIFNLYNRFMPFEQRNIGLIVFFGLSIFTIFSNRYTDKKTLILTAILFIIPAIYINTVNIHNDFANHSEQLYFIHIQPLMWFVYCLVYINFDFKSKNRITDFIKYNGDLIILSTLLAITGMLLSIITIQLFEAINIKIEKFYMDYIGLTGFVIIPILATFIIRNYSNVVNKIAPIIAKIFCPIVLITLIVFLIALPFSGNNLYSDRDFLLIFNVMLLAVMAIIIFSISGVTKDKSSRLTNITLLLLTIVALLIDSIALSAIFYRLNEYGVSPNKLAVLGSNFLVFGNLLLIMIDLVRVNFKNNSLEKVEKTISSYLPLYMLWLIVVVFAFPFLF